MPKPRCPRIRLRLWLTTVLAVEPAAQAAPAPAGAPPLVFPGLLAKAEREAGNPLATYARLLELADRYLASPFAPIYPEVRANYEEFFGAPLAGVRAMSLPVFARGSGGAAAAIDPAFEARDALAVIVAAAARTQLVVFGEEHHLPQTRSLYEPLLRALWQHGYRYLAAETFAEAVMAPGFAAPDYRSGYYLMDPVFAYAVRTARALGYRLVAYEATQAPPPGDAGYRDRKQAENLHARTFAEDPKARVLVWCGRGHAADVPPADGWKPMASVLAAKTGIDPFTIYAPTMSMRQDPAQEHPLFRDADARGLLTRPTIFVHREHGRCLGSGNCDAYVFWPRVRVVDGREDWLGRELGRMPLAVPEALRAGSGLRLVQAFAEGDPVTAIAVDQVLLRDGEPIPVLMLPAGSFWLRSVDPSGTVRGPASVRMPSAGPAGSR